MKHISYRGFNSSALTFESSAEFKKGEPVEIGADGTCSTAAQGDAFIGICVSIRGSLITAQMEGFVEVPYSGAAPAYGWVRLCADGNGGVETTDNENVPLYRVIEVDTQRKTAGFIL